MIGGGALFASAPWKGIQAQREPNGTLQTYAALKKAEDWIAGIDFGDPAKALAVIAKEFDGWAPALTALITDGETDPVLRPLYALPVDHRWSRVPGVTLLEGANLAMYDSAELGKALMANPVDFDTALFA